MASDQNVADRRTSNSGTQALTEIKTLDDVVVSLREFARESPEKFALSCLGVGFILGWKLKPW